VGFEPVELVGVLSNAEERLSVAAMNVENISF
jgi:hypothetical protein